MLHGRILKPVREVAVAQHYSQSFYTKNMSIRDVLNDGGVHHQAHHDAAFRKVTCQKLSAGVVHT
jgi:hypothetical protein